MAIFLATAGIASALDTLLTSAKSEVILISPYVKLNGRTRTRLMDCGQRGISLTFVYGKNEMCEREKSLICEVPGVKLLYSEHLHAKCYLNEDFAIITSMNLYAYSEQTNSEMGVQLSRRMNRRAYEDLREEVEAIVRGSQLHFSAPSQVSLPVPVIGQPIDLRSGSRNAQNRFAQKRRDDQAHTEPINHCIRCRIEKRDSLPLCQECYVTWSFWENASYPERWCLKCGQNKEVCYADPICRTCKGGRYRQRDQGYNKICF